MQPPTHLHRDDVAKLKALGLIYGDGDFGFGYFITDLGMKVCRTAKLMAELKAAGVKLSW
jgi:hypothetical protein